MFDVNNKTFAVDNQLQFNVDTGSIRHTILTGVDYQNSRVQKLLQFGTNTPAPIDVFNPVYNGYTALGYRIGDAFDQRLEQVGVYVQDQMRYDRWLLTLGITCGFALFIAFYAGALTMFQEPIARWASPPAVGVTAVPLEDTPRLLELVAATYPEARQEGITLHLRGRENRPARVTWKENAPPQEGRPHEHVHWWATLKADGTLLAKQEEPSELAEFINAIHVRAGIPEPWGSYLMGMVSLLYGVALIAGVIVLLPSLVKDFLALRIGKNLKRMWQDAHNVVGITALPFHLVIAVTATAWGFGGPLWSAQESVIYGGKQKTVMARDLARFAAPNPTGEAGVMVPPAQLLQRLKDQVPAFEPRVMIFMNFGDKAAAVKFFGAEHGYVGDSAGIILSAVTGHAASWPRRSDRRRKPAATSVAQPARGRR